MTVAAAADPPASQSRRKTAFEVLFVWAMLAVVSTVRALPDLRLRVFQDTDDATRLAQVRELLDGQSWFDLTLARIGQSGSVMQWSRHMDALLAGVILVLRPFVGAETAELVATIVVPLGLLMAALWLVSALARQLSPAQDVGLYAMVVFGFGAGALSRLGPGSIDHHGLQLVLILMVVYMVVRPMAAWTGIAAGAAGGISMTVGLETLPIVAAVLAALGIGWATGSNRSPISYRAFGLSLVGSAIVSSMLFSPPGRLFSLECDVLSLGFLGLVAFPALGLAWVGGAPWSPMRIWGALVAMAAAAFAWFGLVSPSCAAGPYGSLPEQAHRVWIDLIVEAQGLGSVATVRPLDAVTLLIGPVIGLLYLGWLLRSERRFDWVPLAAALLMTLAFGFWQVRVMPMALALAAPALGVLVVRLRNSVRWTPGRAVVALSAALILSGFVTGFLGQTQAERENLAQGSANPCVTEELLAELDQLEPGLVAVEMNYGPAILVGTKHRILASPYHRAYEGVLAVYDLFVAEPTEAESLAHSVDLDYILVCDNGPLSTVWTADNPDGLLGRLLEDSPPDWLVKVIETDEARVYRVQ